MSVQGEQAQQDANQIEESSEPQTQSTDSKTLDSSAQTEVVAATEQSEQEKPFHEHPRFQELIQKNREAEQRAAQYEQMMADMRSKYDELSSKLQPPKQANPFVSKLREIDPAYAEYIESLESKASKADLALQRLEHLETQNLVKQYENQVERLHSDNKTPESVKSLIKEQLDHQALRGEIQLKDVPGAYKKALDRYTKLIDDVKRGERASYVEVKTKDAQIPASQPKGKAPPRNEKGQFTGDREADMALIAKRAVALSKAEKDI